MSDEDHWDEVKHLGACFGKIKLVSLFFAEHWASQDAAKKICATCLIKETCLATHLDEQFGVWGGTSARERSKLSRKKRLAVHA